MTIAAFLVCGLLRPWLDPTFEAPFVAAVALTAWLCGAPYAIAAAVISIPLLNLLFLPPSPLNPATARGFTKLLLFLTANAIIIGLIDSLFRSRAEHAEAEQRHRSLSELIPFGGWIADRNGHMLRVSDSFLNAFDTAVEDCRGLGWLSLIVEPASEQVRSEWLECMRSGYFWDYGYKMRARDGTNYSILSRGVPVRDARGRIQSWVGIHLDVTELERAFEERIQSARDLARFNAELEQFAYVSAHDLQEPLRTIASYLQLLSRRYKGKLDADADLFIEYAVDGANRLKGLLQDLMLLQQVGKSARRRTVCNLGRIAGAAIERIRSRVQQTEAAIIVADLPDVIGDEPELIQLLENLLDNALKYRRPETAPEIRIRSERAAEEWIIRVEDNGMGIEPQYLQRIFDIFQRLHSRADIPGTGIGLAICKKIIEVHGGRIWAQSEPGRGATFCFSLPA
jgi:PAS domain S-box-containing protein